jgi:NAD(P)H-dependent FMN reductase
MSTRILALVGSLRARSDNRRLAEAAVKLAPSAVLVEIFEGLADVAVSPGRTEDGALFERTADLSGAISNPLLSRVCR